MSETRDDRFLHFDESEVLATIEGLTKEIEEAGVHISALWEMKSLLQNLLKHYGTKKQPEGVVV